MGNKYFSNSLGHFLGYKIGIYTRDGQLVEGVLFDVQGDFLTISDEMKNLTFFNLDLVQAIVKNTKEFKPSEEVNHSFEDNSLMNIMGKHIYHWVTVKLHNQLSFSGILSKASNDHILLTVRDKQHYIQAAHILDFFPGTPNENNESEKSNLNTEVKQTNKKEENRRKNNKKTTDPNETKNKSKQKSSNMKKDNRKGRYVIDKKDLRNTLGQIIQDNSLSGRKT